MSFLIALFVIYPLCLLANEPPMETGDFIQFLIALVQQLKGATPLVIAGAVVEALLVFTNSKPFNFLFGKLKGHIKLTIVLVLSYLAGILSLKIAGEPWLVALTSSASLSAFLVLANQIYKQYFVKKD